MKHIGDIAKINGKLIAPVDIITGGSPCQDLSVAGKRAGLAGERSGLFMEQIRVIKEMRRATNGKQPRFMVWENVPGAFSSNKGEDFRCVLEETARVTDQDAVIPGLEGKQRWTPSGCIMGDGWSIAWRVHDAQFWGVPQRRKRISLVADFAGGDAPEILFEREGMPGNTEESGKEREGTAEDTENSIREAGKCLNSWDVQSKHIQPENGIAESLYAGECRYGGGESYVMQSVKAIDATMPPNVVYGISSFDSNAMKSSNPHSGIYEAETSRTLDLNGGNPACNQGGMAVVRVAPHVTPNIDEKGIAFTLNQRDYKDPQVVVLEGNGSRPSHRGDGYAESETMYILNSTEHHAVCVENHPADSRVKISDNDVVQTLSGRMGTGGGNVPLIMSKTPICVSATYQNITGTLSPGQHAGSYNGQDASNDMLVSDGYIVRRLTPLECERLQGFPDHWTDIGEWVDSKGKKHRDADSPRYKALGNSIALPFWKWMAERMVRHIHGRATMGSLFDGIGGFPLAFSEYGCIPVWASEIEEFCIAVTNKRFNEV